MEKQERRRDWSEGLTTTRKRRLGELGVDAAQTTQGTEESGQDLAGEIHEERLHARFGKHITERMRRYDGI